MGTFAGARRSGFTLIELLVVIAIIAILAAIIFPVFVSAKARAKVVSCVSQQKQCGLALLAYCADYSDTVCLASRWTVRTGTYSDWSNLMLWFDCIKPYTTDKVDIAYCPAMPRTSLPSFTKLGVENSHASKHWSTIGINLIVGCEQDFDYNTPIKLADIRTKTRTIAFGCSSLGYSYNRRRNPDVSLDWPREYGYFVLLPGWKSAPLLSKAPRTRAHWYPYHTLDPDRHDGKVVICHFDGHVSVYDVNRILTPNRTAGDWMHPDFSMWDMY